MAYPDGAAHDAMMDRIRAEEKDGLNDLLVALERIAYPANWGRCDEQNFPRHIWMQSVAANALTEYGRKSRAG